MCRFLVKSTNHVYKTDKFTKNYQETSSIRYKLKSNGDTA